MQQIEIGLLFPSPNARALDKKNVARLTDSIREVGLLNAITVRKVEKYRGPSAYEAFEIVGGHHRYAAALELKWRTIRCEVMTMEGLKAELAEIDENLIRADLTPAQTAAAVSRRKIIYEELHPETKAPKEGGSFRGNQHREVTAESAVTTFTAATARATGKAERTVREAAHRGKTLGTDLEDIAGTSLDKGSELDALADMTPEERAPLIQRAKAGERVSARPAKPPKIAADPLTDELAAEKQVARLMDAWNAAGPDARQEFLLRIDQPIMDSRYGSAA